MRSGPTERNISKFLMTTIEVLETADEESRKTQQHHHVH